MKQLLIAVLCAIVSLSAYAHESTPQPDNISVVGVGEIEAEPDQATLSVSVFAQEKNLAEAKRVADQRYRRVLAVIKQAQIGDEFVKATRITAQPQYEYRSNKRVYTGERVSRSLNIIVNELDKVSPLMQALVENEVSTIDSLNTGFKDRKALQKKALAAAADDAKSKAKFLAERLGRDLGSAYLISEHNSNTPQVYRREMSMATKSYAAAEAPPPEMFGTKKISATVNVSFNLL